MAREWTCQRQTNGVRCGRKNPSRYQVCRACGKRKPPRKAPAHRKVLDDYPYEWWVERFGEVCGICGRPPKNRRLDRDHCHVSGAARGLLCHACNRALPNYVTAEWLERALAYLQRSL